MVELLKVQQWNSEIKFKLARINAFYCVEACFRMQVNLFYELHYLAQNCRVSLEMKSPSVRVRVTCMHTTKQILPVLVYLYRFYIRRTLKTRKLRLCSSTGQIFIFVHSLLFLPSRKVFETLRELLLNSTLYLRNTSLFIEVYL